MAGRACRSTISTRRPAARAPSRRRRPRSPPRRRRAGSRPGLTESMRTRASSRSIDVGVADAGAVCRIAGRVGAGRVPSVLSRTTIERRRRGRACGTPLRVVEGGADAGQGGGAAGARGDSEAVESSTARSASVVGDGDGRVAARHAAPATPRWRRCRSSARPSRSPRSSRWRARPAVRLASTHAAVSGSTDEHCSGAARPGVGSGATTACGQRPDADRDRDEVGRPRRAARRPRRASSGSPRRSMPGPARSRPRRCPGPAPGPGCSSANSAAAPHRGVVVAVDPHHRRALVGDGIRGRGQHHGRARTRSPRPRSRPPCGPPHGRGCRRWRSPAWRRDAAAAPGDRPRRRRAP